VAHGARATGASAAKPMIISHQHKFIFIKTAKTAGTSIEVFLSQQCGPADILTPIDPPVESHRPRNYEGWVTAFYEVKKRDGLFAALRHPLARRRKFYRHMPAWVVRTRVSAQIWDGYFKFCVERNPWDKVLSHYHMHRARKGGSLSLDQYFAKGKFPINYVRYTDPSGSNIIVDRVVRYENLINELAEVFARVNVRFEGNLGVKAKGEYRTDRTPYQLMFNSEQQRIVERVFAREIELHGYRFEQNS
jgi:hypothetical protein